MYDSIAKKSQRPDIPDACPPTLKDLITKCWNPAPQNRPSFSSILKSNEFEKILIEVLISAPNELGRSVWRKHFLEKVYLGT
jgi:hypothetical protein